MVIKKIFFILIICFAYYSTIFASSSSSVIQSEIKVSESKLIVDGKLNDEVWQNVKSLTLKPAVVGVPEGLGGNVRIMVLKNHICIGAFCSEPGGKVLAKSIGYNPIWERGAEYAYRGEPPLTSPPMEDRLQCKIRFTTIWGKESELRVEVNPFGALVVERDGKMLPITKTVASASITADGWVSETAIPLDELGLSSSNERIKIGIEQIRSARPLAPEFRWLLDTSEEYIDFLIPQKDEKTKKISNVIFSPPLLGNKEQELQVCYVQEIPPIGIDWDDPFWKSVPALKLSRNEPNPRIPEFPTEVKFVHNGKTLSVFFRCVEDERVVCNTGGWDGNVSGDDHVFIYLATSGSSLIEILANPAGAIRDSKITGPNLFRIFPASFNGNINKHSSIVSDFWYVRLDLPLDEISRALGELDIPENLKILIGRVRQSRVGETREISTIPVIENPFFYAPARYQRLALTSRNSTQISVPEPAYTRPEMSGLSKELSTLTPYVLSRVERKYINIPNMLNNQMDKMVTSLAMEEHKEWNSVKTLADWEQYRAKRIDNLKNSFGAFPKVRSPLLYQVTGSVKGEGYQVKNIVYQSRPGFYIAANLYLPENPENKMPGIIIIPAQLNLRTQGELKDMGMVFAKTGCAVLVPETFGHGERIETTPWNQQAYRSEYIFDMQLALIGQSRYGWIVWDIMRTVDLFYEMGNIDENKIIIIGGSTAGSGSPSAVSAMFEERIDAAVVFNFGRMHWTNSGWRLRNTTTNKIPDWFISASIAPRKFIYAHEFWWEGEEGPDYPSVWVPAWPRYKEVFELYNAENNLTTIQGFGLLNLDMGHSFIGPPQRKEMLEVFKKWFNFPDPPYQDMHTELESYYLTDSPDYSLLKYKEEVRRRFVPNSALQCINPEVSAKLNRKPLHQIASEIANDLLLSARSKRKSLDALSSNQNLMKDLSQILGDIEPNKNPKIERLWSKNLSGATVEASILYPESDILIPMFIIKPVNLNKSIPIVLTLSEGGKGRFLIDRSKEIELLIKNGIAVCLLDVRGTGESAPDQYNFSRTLLFKELALGNTPLGLRLKDVRTVLAYIKTLDGIDYNKIALWGDSFSPVNNEDIWLDELSNQPISPQIQHYVSPLGAHLALLTALYSNEVSAVAVRGGLVGYLSILDNNFTYAPPDIIVSEILEKGDISDICSVLAPKPLLIEKFVDGRNFVVKGEKLQEKMALVNDAYKKSGSVSNLIIREDSAEPDIISWMIKQLKK